jgi:translation initiation factor 2 gamma subunit (eIF-2gamma)
MKLKTNQPICAEIGQKISFGRQYFDRYRLIGCGDILDGVEADITW